MESRSNVKLNWTWDPKDLSLLHLWHPIHSHSVSSVRTTFTSLQSVFKGFTDGHCVTSIIGQSTSFKSSYRNTFYYLTFSLLCVSTDKPTINTTKLPELVPVISGYKEELVCEADGNPAPKITWNYTSATAFLGSNGTLIVNEEGSYICIANNSLTTDTREVKVILKGN